jgi:hypothetical protein
VLFRLGCRYKNDPLVLLPITPGCAGSFSSLCACTDYDTAVEWVEQWNGLNDNPDKAKFIKVLVEIEFAPKQAAAVANWTRQVPRP